MDTCQVLEIGDSLIPTGTLRGVAGTPVDVRAPAAVGGRIERDHNRLRRGRGYDRTYVISPGEGGGGRPGFPSTVPRRGEGYGGRIVDRLSTRG